MKMLKIGKNFGVPKMDIPIVQSLFHYNRYTKVISSTILKYLNIG